MLAHDSRAIVTQSYAVQTTCDEPPVLHRETFETLRSILPDSALKEIFTVFLADTRERISLLDESRASGLLPVVAHSICGSAGMVGAIAIAGLAERLELDPDAASRLLAACEQLQATLRAEGLNL